MIPVRCFTCGKVVDDKLEAYLELVRLKKTEKEALDLCGLSHSCCRRMIVSGCLYSADVILEHARGDRQVSDGRILISETTPSSDLPRVFEIK